jgi:hypothetical protein
MFLCDIANFKNCRLLGCNGVKFGESPTFQENVSNTQSGLLLRLLFASEYKGDIFIRNVRLSPEDRRFQIHHREDLKYNTSGIVLYILSRL